MLHREGANKTLTMEGSTVACFTQTDELYLLSRIFPFQQRSNALQKPVDSGDNRCCFSAHCKGATAQTTGSSTIREVKMTENDRKFLCQFSPHPRWRLKRSFNWANGSTLLLESEETPQVVAADLSHFHSKHKRQNIARRTFLFQHS